MSLFIIFTILAIGFFYLFFRGPYKLNPLWLMLSVWMLGLGIPQLNLSQIEKDWYPEYWGLVLISLLTFSLGFLVFNQLFSRLISKHPNLFHTTTLYRNVVSNRRLRMVIYVLFAISLIALVMFYVRAGNFPLLAESTDVFRFQADEQVPGLINYTAQFARLFIPLSFFLFFYEGFSLRKHWDLGLIGFLGLISLLLFASRTQIFFIDIWIMALYLFMRKPSIKQAIKFYPIFLLISILVLAAVPIYRQYKSYGSADYLAGVTAIDSSSFNPFKKALLPIYVGVSFNQQSLLHAHEYYETHPIQRGRVTLDPFTNILGLDQLKSDFDLCNIFKCWWNTGTYLFPFVQDFGDKAFYIIPFFLAGILTLAWRYWVGVKNFFSHNLYAYAMFFIVMSIYLSFTVRAEMYLDLFLLFVIYLIVSKVNVSTSLNEQ